MEKEFNGLTIRVDGKGTFVNITHVNRDPYLYESREYPLEQAEWLQECLSTALEEIAREDEAPACNHGLSDKCPKCVEPEFELDERDK